MKCLLSGNDFCGGPEAMCCHAHPGDRLILSTHNMLALGCSGLVLIKLYLLQLQELGGIS